LADAILRWEGEGIRTRRLEAALDADSAPDVDALLGDFSRDARRLLEIARELNEPPADPALLIDPDRLAEAEAFLAGQRGPDGKEAEAPLPTLRPARPPADPWFLDRERFCWRWTALDERLLEERK
ncbi:MAG TPA: hypothetical protein VFI96_07155, partial [Longimicrobiaceae bacterium]|nr:hypothetical protein [Longimicrobiaceae bacterium]